MKQNVSTWFRGSFFTVFRHQLTHNQQYAALSNLTQPDIRHVTSFDLILRLLLRRVETPTYPKHHVIPPDTNRLKCFDSVSRFLLHGVQLPTYPNPNTTQSNLKNASINWRVSTFFRNSFFAVFRYTPRINRLTCYDLISRILPHSVRTSVLTACLTPISNLAKYLLKRCFLFLRHLSLVLLLHFCFVDPLIIVVKKSSSDLMAWYGSIVAAFD